MIPRKILKSIRQIELRTNQIANETLCLCSLQSSPESSRALAAVPNCNDFDLAVFRADGEKHGVRPAKDFRFSRQTTNQWKSFRLRGQGLEHGMDFSVETLADTRFLFIIPLHRLVPLSFRCGLGDDAERHFLARKRSLISAKTCSEGFPRPGCFKDSSALRTSSAICAADNSSSPHSLRTRSAISRCSGAGKRRICSRISVALMALKYRVAHRWQGCVCFALRIPHSAFA